MNEWQGYFHSNSLRGDLNPCDVLNGAGATVCKHMTEREGGSREREKRGRERDEKQRRERRGKMIREREREE